ncbi:GntR family transcriptional regulator [Aquamicrobium terrae]
MSEMASGSRALRTNTPLATRFAEDMHRRLRSGEWKVGDRLPSEALLCEEYNVSRATVRIGIRLLISQGLVRSRQGSGSYVTAAGSNVSAGLAELRSTTETIRQQGLTPAVQCRLSEMRTPTQECVDAFGLSATDRVLYLERAIRANGRIVAYCRDEIVDGVVPAPYLAERFCASLFDTLEAASGLRPAYSSSTICAVYDESIAWVAGEPEHPLYLLFRQAHFTEAGAPVVYSRDYFVDGAFTFSVRRVSPIRTRDKP